VCHILKVKKNFFIFIVDYYKSILLNWIIVFQEATIAFL